MKKLIVSYITFYARCARPNQEDCTGEQDRAREAETGWFVARQGHSEE